MTAIVLDGLATAKEIRADLSARVAKLKEQGVTPGLGTILVGDDPGSHAYVSMKHRDSGLIGINSIDKRLPATASQAEVEAAVQELNEDPSCHAYLVQLPLPKHLDEFKVLEKIDQAKDADGLHPLSLGKLVLGEPTPLPCTPWGCVVLLRRFGVELNGADVVVVGRGITVGRPIGLILSRKSENATVTLCHTGTRDLADKVRRADIVIAAVGVPHMITPDMIKPGAAVLDVGVSHVNGKLTGDVHPDVAEVAGFLSPNPGGVGPMTRSLLLTNVVEAAERAAASR